MVNQQLIDYIKTEEAQGHTLQQLRNYLLQQGYKSSDIEEAINYANAETHQNNNQSQDTQSTSNFKVTKINQQLIDYIKTEEAQGYTPQQLRSYLLQQGYKSSDIEEAINYANAETSQNNNQSQDIQSTLNSATGIKKRNPLLVFLFSIITFGIYSIYWIVSTTNELKKNTQSAPNPLLLLLMLIPFVNFIVLIIYFWKYSKAINELTGFNSLLLFLLWLFLGPIAIILSQIELNKKAL